MTHARFAPLESGAPVPDQAARVLVRLLPMLIRLMAAELHRAPDSAEMTMPQFKVLARLSERDYRAAELASALEVGRPTVTATADCLVRRGLVERVRDLPGDRRGVLLRLTPSGRALYSALQARAVAAVADLLAESSPAERAGLDLGLAALERGLQSAGYRPLPRVVEVR